MAAEGSRPPFPMLIRMHGKTKYGRGHLQETGKIQLNVINKPYTGKSKGQSQTFLDADYISYLTLTMLVLE